VRPVALAGPANRAGRLVADAILRPEHARPLPRPVGTAIVRVGAQTVAMTGANRAALAAAGIDADTLHLHPGQHAGYFPGASQIHLVVHIRRSDGLLLGAQAVGADGVDKRIDVLATAIRAGWAVDELIDLDLAYAPPYGSARIPSTWSGWSARTSGAALRLWYAQDVDAVAETALILDVRTPRNCPPGICPGARHPAHRVARPARRGACRRRATRARHVPVGRTLRDRAPRPRAGRVRTRRPCPAAC
jgi:hypothetical protein